MIQGCGLATLEVAANSYISVLGSPEYAAVRLNFSQGFQGIASFSGPLIASRWFFTGANATSLGTVQWFVQQWLLAVEVLNCWQQGLSSRRGAWCCPQHFILVCIHTLLCCCKQTQLPVSPNYQKYRARRLPKNFMMESRNHSGSNTAAFLDGSHRQPTCESLQRHFH